MIHVIAVIKAKTGQRDSVLAAFKDNMPAVHAEQGCICLLYTSDAADE